MKHHLILKVITKFMVGVIVLFGLYVQFHGDFGPGGGFQAGVMFAAAFILHSLVGRIKDTQKAISPMVIEKLIPLGVLLYAGTGIWCMVKGGNFLDYNALNPEHPAHGQHVGILLVEAGVGITVFSAMLALFFTFAMRGRK